MLVKEIHRGKDHSDQPIWVLAVFCRVTPTLSVPLVSSRSRQLLDNQACIARGLLCGGPLDCKARASVAAAHALYTRLYGQAIG